MALRAKLIPAALACGMAGSLAAQESDAPDLGFLEFLGSWEEDDDEWFVVAGLADDEFGVVADADVLESDELVDLEGADETEEPGQTEETEETVDSGDSNDGERTDETETADAD